MIFSCGETWEAEKRRLGEWHPFFALFPRTVAIENNRVVCAWLQTIQRKGRICEGYPFVHWMWEYRLSPSAAGERKE